MQPDVYANNRLSLLMVQSSAKDALMMLTGFVFGGAAALGKTMKDPDYGPSYEPARSALMYQTDDANGEDYFSWLKRHVTTFIYLIDERNILIF